jgi:hypothetical protein
LKSMISRAFHFFSVLILLLILDKQYVVSAVLFLLLVIHPFFPLEFFYSR